MPPPTKDSVLDLDVRRRIVDTVREHPGMHLRALAEEMDLPVSTLEYHCYQLVRHGRMTSRQDGGYKSFYPAEGIDRRDKDILYLVRHDAPRRVCTHLLEHPGATPKEIRQALGMAAPTLSFHIKKLVNAGLIVEEPAGRTKHLFLEDAERVATVLVTYRASFVDAAVDRFAETWLAVGRPVRGAEREGNGPGGDEPAPVQEAEQAKVERAPDGDAQATSDAGDDASGKATEGSEEDGGASDVAKDARTVH